jgi:hypothetical protein
VAPFADCIIIKPVQNPIANEKTYPHSNEGFLKTENYDCLGLYTVCGGFHPSIGGKKAFGTKPSFQIARIIDIPCAF